MRTFLLTSLLLLMSANLMAARLQVRIVVDVLENKNSEVAKGLQEGLEARLNSTERYSVTVKPGSADILLSVSCMIVHGQTIMACESEVFYFPYADSSLLATVETAEGMAFAGVDATTFIVESLMNHFINGTTDLVLRQRKDSLREAVRLLCINHPGECKNPAP